LSAFLGIFLAYWFWLKKPGSADTYEKSALSHFFYTGWRFDTVYDFLFVKPVVWLSEINKNDFIDKVYNGIAYIAGILHHTFLVIPDRQIKMVRYGHCPWCSCNFNPGDIHMILITLILILFIAGILSWFAGRINGAIPRWISLIAALANLIISVYIWIVNFGSFTITGGNNWIIDYQTAWIPRFGISLHFAMDGLSLLMVVLTSLIGVLSVLISWTEIKDRVGFFHFNLMFILAGITGVFLALDLFLFYFFWEVMLIPMYFLIGIWGHENRQYAAYKFFIFTQASGLLMLLPYWVYILLRERQPGIIVLIITILLVLLLTLVLLHY
jgi:NADH:ubiquinone oxidoreductase subunit 5 (subunit L)/multisubunit Na+/H+ antiporter MnhA subunit